MRTTSGAPDADQLLTPAQVAHRFNVSRSTITRWTQQGTLPVIRIGKGIVRYQAADIDRLMSEGLS